MLKGHDSPLMPPTTLIILYWSFLVYLYSRCLIFITLISYCPIESLNKTRRNLVIILSTFDKWAYCQSTLFDSPGVSSVQYLTGPIVWHVKTARVAKESWKLYFKLTFQFSLKYSFSLIKCARLRISVPVTSNNKKEKQVVSFSFTWYFKSTSIT